MKTTKRKTSPVKVNYLVDLGIFLVFLLAMDPRSTGLAIHEWLSIALGAAVVAHLLLHWSWIVATTRRIWTGGTRQARLNYVVNVILFAAMTTLIASGLFISRSAMPALGIEVPLGGAWRGLHGLSADLILVGIGLHIALHWRWIVSTTKRYVLAPVMARMPRPVATAKEEVGE